jgi:hypothetical protein
VKYSSAVQKAVKMCRVFSLLRERKSNSCVSGKTSKSFKEHKKMRSKLMIVGFIAGLLSIGTWSNQGQTDKARNVSYEYQVVTDPTAWAGRDEGIKKLNALGAQGWEITGVVQIGEDPPTLYLKRGKP